MNMRAKFSPRIGLEGPPFETSPNEEPIGPWIKMAVLDQWILPKKASSQFLSGELSTSLVKCFFVEAN